MSRFARHAVCLAGMALIWGAADPVAARGQEAAGPPVLYLHTEFLPYPDATSTDLPYRLGRELMRQAVLVAARDELHAVTRDETLREDLPQSSQVVHLLLRERATTAGEWTVQLIRPEDRQVVWQKKYAFPVHGGKMYGDVVPKLELDTRDELVKALLAAGLPRPTAPSAAGPLGSKLAVSDVDPWLNEVDIVAQFAAVRAAHLAIREQGETPEWLAVLVRGYANLALLTPHYWSSLPEAFTARAWLYAQRLVVKYPQYEPGRLHRAYAWAWGGALQHALDDLAQLPGTGTRESSGTPPWGRLVSAYGDCDRNALAQIAKESIACKPWSLVLQCLLVRCEDDYYALTPLLKEVAESCPTAYVTYVDAVHYSSASEPSMMGASWGSEAFGRSVPLSLAKVPDLPSSIQSLVAAHVTSNNTSAEDDNEEVAARYSPVPKEIASRLRRAAGEASGSDPSWSILATLLEEEQFVQVLHSCAHQFHMFNRPISQRELQRVLPLVKGHRYAPFVEALGHDFQQDQTEVSRLLGSIKIIDPRMNMVIMFGPLWYVNDAAGQGAGRLAFEHAHRNFTLLGMLEFAHGYEMRQGPPSGPLADMLSDEVREVAPRSDKFAAWKLAWAQTPTLEQLQEWTTQLKQNSLALFHLAERYRDAGEIAAAIGAAERSVNASSRPDVVVLLAQLYWGKHDYAAWEKALLNYLASAEPSLDAGPLMQELFGGYAELGEWVKGKPYAQRAAQTGSADGLWLYARACEGLALWDESERTMRAASEGYANESAYYWYFWCRRNGRGDVSAAAKLVKENESLFNRRNRTITFYEGAYHLLNGDSRQAMEAFRIAHAEKATFSCAFYIAQLAREAGDERGRMEVLNAMQKTAMQESLEATPEDRAMNAVGLAILQLIKTGDASTERLAKIEKSLANVESITRSSWAYLLGQELEYLGKHDEAEKYWRRSLTTPSCDMAAVTLAGFALSKRHGTSRPDDDAWDENDLWPPRRSGIAPQTTGESQTD